MAIHDMKTSDPAEEAVVQRLDFDTPAMHRKRRRRALRDRLTGWAVSVGGLAVLGTITLIFFYLAYMVVPIFRGASVQFAEPVQADRALPQEAPLLLWIEDQNKLAMRLDASGLLRFFEIDSGKAVTQLALPLPQDTRITSVGQGPAGAQQAVVGLSNGQALVFQLNYQVSYPDGVRQVSPQLVFPFGQQPLDLEGQKRPLQQVALALRGASSLLLVGAHDHQLSALRISATQNLMTGETRLQSQRLNLPSVAEPVKALLLDPRQTWLYLVTGKANAEVFDLRNGKLQGHYRLLPGDAEVTALQPLLGGISLMVGGSDGSIGQWFMVRHDDGSATLTRVRGFQLGEQRVTQILPEQRRKGFVALDKAGRLGIFHSTSQRTLLRAQLPGDPPDAAALAPMANMLLLEKGGQLRRVAISNPHPEISWHSLWGKVWYENYQAPQYVWQSTSASGEFEPKLSLTPLTFGTLKAAFYAMLLAAPLAISAAIYTAYFMAPGLRRKVKPVIELMEALPTVILGFFAGLVLAPYVEGHLPGVFTLLLVTPLGALLFAFLWSRLPAALRQAVPEGYEAALLIPVIVLLALASLHMSGYLETWLFAGNMRAWLSEHGIAFDQRNALVVGLAMGFAVIPAIFSIAEDAVFSVPRNLTLGSLALGATPWQTLSRVVILTASPGIFSAMMIGLGRAVGETMIVLMATGNTAIMDANIFQGMRTLAANIAVEMPESEVGSTHYRVLFLAALVLLSFTFVMNTLAEVIRNRLRKRYASL